MIFLKRKFHLGRLSRKFLHFVLMMFWYVSITLKHSWKKPKVETVPVYIFFSGEEEKEWYPWLFWVALKFRVLFEMCAMLGPGEEAMIDYVEGWNFYDDDNCLMKTLMSLVMTAFVCLNIIRDIKKNFRKIHVSGKMEQKNMFVGFRNALFYFLGPAFLVSF